MNRNLLTIMLFAAVTLIVRCAHIDNHFEADKLVECKFSTKESISQIKVIFESATILPLEQSEDSIVSSMSELIEFNGDYYLIDKQKHRCLRFDKDGKFKNSIGRRGRAGDEYLDIASVQVDGDDILIYSKTTQKIYRYSIEGNFVGALETAISAQQLLKVGDKYYGYFGYNNGQQEERILVYNDSFEPVGQFLPSLAKIIVFSEEVSPMMLFAGEIYVRETYSNCIYKISGDGELSTPIAFDFGSYNIPQQCFNQLDPYKAAEIMLSSDFASIGRFEQNANYSLVSVNCQMAKDMQIYNMVGARCNGADYNWITATPAGPNALLFSSVRHISDEGVVTALVDVDVVDSFNDNNLGFIENGEILQSLEGSNPLIVKLKMR